MTMKRLWILAWVLLLAGMASAEQKLTGFCTVGGQKVVSQGLTSTTQVQVSYPQCTVTVYATGTTNLATLHSDNVGTPLANPFTANTNGSWGFYTANGRYDIVLSKTSSSGFPFTISDVIFCDPTNCGGGGGGGSGTVTSVGVSASNTGLSVANSPVTTAGVIALTSNASAADQSLRSTATGVSSYTAIPDCQDLAGNHLNYAISTHLYSCGTSGGGGTGTVTSVGLTTTNTGFQVSGSPVTTSGTLAMTATATDQNQTPITTASGTVAWSSLPNCPDTAGQHWNFNSTTHQVSCGSSSGAAGNLINFQGTWDASRAYAQNDGVLLNGSSYVALSPNTGVQPGTDSGVTWQLIAQAGTNGVNGTNGTNGADGAPGAPGYSPNQIKAGCGVAYNSGLNFTVQPCTYIIQGTQYSSALTTVTGTTADPTLARIDAIIVDTTGVVSIVAGTPASTPSNPTLDTNTQLQITFYTVDAGATVPTNVSTTAVYINNAEWTCASTANFNCASTNNPHSGTLDIEATSAATGNNVRLTIPSGTIDPNNYDKLNFFARSKATWASTRSLTIQLYNGTTAKCTPVTLRDGNFTFNSATIGSYQLITVPMSLFSCGGIPITQIRFTVAGTGTTIGFYLDDITLQGGLVSPAGSSSMIWKGTWSSSTAYSVNDTVFYNGNTFTAIQANTNLTPTSAPLSWSSHTSYGPAGVDGNLQYKCGNVFCGLNTVIAASDITFPGTITATRIISSDTVNNTEMTFTTGSGGDATCPSPLAGTSYLCTKSSTVEVSQNGAAYAAISTGGGSVTSIATTSPITGGTITTTGTIACATCAIGPGTSTANHLAKFSGTDGVTLADGGAIPAGTVTSIATTSPLGGGTITGTGTLTCATCVIASSPGAGVAHFAGSTQTVTSSAIVGADMTNNTVTSTQTAVVNNRRICNLQVGDGTNTVVTADYSPFKVNACVVPYAATIVEIDVQTDAGTPSVLLERRRGAATVADLLSGALAAAGTTWTCALTGTAGTCLIAGGTTSSGSITLSNTSLNAGDVIEVKSGTGSTETSMRIAVVFTVN
jgi:hypothetical protein